MRRPPDLRVLWPLLVSDLRISLSTVGLAITGAFLATFDGEVSPVTVGRAIALPPLLFTDAKGLGALIFPLMVGTAMVLLANRLSRAGLVDGATRSFLRRWLACTAIVFASSIFAPLLSIPAWLYGMYEATEGMGALPLSMLVVGPSAAIASSWVFGELTVRAAMGLRLKLTLKKAVAGRVLVSFALWTISTMILSAARQAPIAYALGLFAAVAQLMLVCSMMIAMDAISEPSQPSAAHGAI